MDDYEEEDDGGDGDVVHGLCWKWCCEPCVHCWELVVQRCWTQRNSPSRPGHNNIKKEEITYILQGPGEGESDTYSEGGERHGSFTSASLSVGSSHHSNDNKIKDLKEYHYDKIEQARRASGWTMRKESTVTTTGPIVGAGSSMGTLLDLRSLDFWSGFTGSSRSSASEPQPVQPKNLLSPGRRDTISSQGSADQIRPDLYETVRADDASGGGDDGESCPSGENGAVHFFLSFDINSNSLIVRMIEIRDLPKPIQMDSTKTDQAHSNPYVKICLLPNQKDSRQTNLRKKTQNPRFDESFSFEIPFKELQKRTLQILVKDFDRYSRHRVIGQVLLPCAEVNVVKGAHIWRQLEPVQTQTCQDDLGEILFSLCYLPAAGRMNVDILRAKQLVPTDLVGGAAPYVRVSVIINDRHVKTKKTSYKKYTLDPVFNESLSFDVNCIQLQDATLVLSVLDFNGGVVKDNFIGRVVLGKECSGPHEVNHWKNMSQSHRTAIAQWHSLKSREHCDQHSPVSRIIT